jgi:acyl carrier protein
MFMKNKILIDSLDQIELQMEIERRFSVSIPEEESEKLISIGDTVQYLLNQRNY